MRWLLPETRFTCRVQTFEDIHLRPLLLRASFRNSTIGNRAVYLMSRCTSKSSIGHRQSNSVLSFNFRKTWKLAHGVDFILASMIRCQMRKITTDDYFRFGNRKDRPLDHPSVIITLVTGADGEMLSEIERFYRTSIVELSQDISDVIRSMNRSFPLPGSTYFTLLIKYNAFKNSRKKPILMQKRVIISEV